MSVGLKEVSFAETYSLRVQLDAAPATNQLPIVGRFDYLVNDPADPQRQENEINATTNGTIPVTLVGGGTTGGRVSQLIALSVFNADTATRILTFTVFNGVSVTKTKWVFKLDPGDIFIYEAEKGIEIRTLAGLTK